MIAGVVFVSDVRIIAKGSKQAIQEKLHTAQAEDLTIGGLKK